MAYVSRTGNSYCVGNECCDGCEQRALTKSLIDRTLAQREEDERARLRGCVHEAGHVAMMQYFFGDDAVLSARVKSSGAGETVAAKQPKADYHVLVSIYAAGAAAEAKFFGQPPDVCANDSFLDDLAAVADCRKHWRKPGSVTRAFSDAAIAVKEEIFDREPDVWEKVMRVASALFEALDGLLVLLPEQAAALEHDERVKQYMRRQRQPKTSKSFRRLMRDPETFWKSGILYP